MRQASRGDFTGKESERLREEHREELKAREGQVGMVNEAPVEERDDTVYGLDSQPVEDVPEVVVLHDDDPIYEMNGEAVEPAPPPRQLRRTKKTEQVTLVTERRAVGADEPQEAKTEYRIMRVNTDVEDMTYWVGNNYTFLRGRRYHVPDHIYRHLDSKGLVAH